MSLNERKAELPIQIKTKEHLAESIYEEVIKVKSKSKLTEGILEWIIIQGNLDLTCTLITKSLEDLSLVVRKLY